MDRSQLPDDAFIDPRGGNREAVERLLGNALERLIRVAAGAGERPPLPGEPFVPAELLPATPRSEGEILDELERMIVTSMNPAHPGYAAHMDPLPSSASIIAALGAAIANNNMLSVELSPVFTRLEHAVTDALAREIGLGDRSGGVLTGGGSLANLTAMAVARNTTFDVADRGMHTLPGRAVCFASELAHTSLQKAAMLLGLGRSGVVPVRADEEGRMRPEALSAAIEAARWDGSHPFAVVATVGTTSTGSVDPVPRIAEVAREEGLWLHVDAAYGGAVMFSARHRALLEGVEAADSVTFNPQKWLYVTKTCAMVLFRDRDLWIRRFHTPLPYMDDTEVNLGEVGVQGTRHPDVLKLWATLQHLGRSGAAALVDESCRLASRFAGALAERPFLRLACRPALNIVCFRGEPSHVPPGALDEWNGGLKNHLLERCGAAFSGPRLRGARWLKAVLLNPYTETSDVDSWLDAIDAFASEHGT